MLRFRLLGEPQIWYGDVRLDKLLRRKEVALLIFLVCEGTEFRRERLATLLWGECGQSQALYRLRCALWSITNAMRSIGLDREAFLRVDRHEVRFLSDAPFSLDTRAFREDTIGLYGPFLGTFTVNNAPEFEEWHRLQCAVFEMALRRTTEVSMTKREDVMLVKLGLGAMAADKGDTFAAAFFTRRLNDVADAKARMMARRLASIPGIGDGTAIQLLAQLGWFVSQTIDSDVASML